MYTYIYICIFPSDYFFSPVPVAGGQALSSTLSLEAVKTGIFAA